MQYIQYIIIVRIVRADKDIELVTNSAFACQAFLYLWDGGKCIMFLILGVGEVSSLSLPILLSLSPTCLRICQHIFD